MVVVSQDATRIVLGIALNCTEDNSTVHDCLKQNDLIKYNPYFEVNSYDTDDNEKTYSPNTTSACATEIVSRLSDIMEKCTISDIHVFNKKSFPMNSLKFHFLNIDGNTFQF